FLGTEPAYFLMLPLFFWLVQRSFGRRLGYIFVLAVYLNSFFKNLFGLPRPFQIDDRVVRLVAQDGYGLPSGHSMTPLALWGYVAWQWRRRLPWLAPVVAVGVALIAFSRLYLGVHFPADVLTGLALGLIVLAAFVKFQPEVARWITQSDDRTALALGVAVPLALLLLMPGDESGYPAEGGATITGMLLGANIGFFYEARRVRMAVAGSVGRRVMRYVLGLAMVVVFWIGLRLLFGLIPGGHAAAIALRFIRYAITGCALTWWAPAAFVRLGLAGQEEPSG
ncbi:MAG: phosphatase PAP2 family protein, partial [Anaerolineae bacterium]